MTFEFVLVHTNSDEGILLGVLGEMLLQALEYNSNSFDAANVPDMIMPQERRTLYATGEEIFERRFLLGFKIELPDEAEEPRSVRDDFVTALSGELSIVHFAKFEDSLLYDQLIEWGREIFALEMKLRRVLTHIYLSAYPNASPYNLLAEEKVQPQQKPSEDQMKSATENQFFHLLFSNYPTLNHRPEHQLKGMIEMLSNATSFEAWQSELLRKPVQKTEDADLLANLITQTTSIEALRNCIAHNRTPPERTLRNYQTARPLLDATLDAFLSNLQGEEQL